MHRSKVAVVRQYHGGATGGPMQHHRVAFDVTRLTDGHGRLHGSESPYYKVASGLLRSTPSLWSFLGDSFLSEKRIVEKNLPRTKISFRKDVPPNERGKGQLVCPWTRPEGERSET